MFASMIRPLTDHATKALLALLVLSVSACSQWQHPVNRPIGQTNDSGGYRLTHARGGKMGDSLVLLSFSGGGTRAAALSYGVLHELRDTLIDSKGSTLRLLDEVDSISSVSGGSFTAAYYGLFGERLFEDYKSDFLDQSIQGSLIRKLFDPSYWWRSLATGFDRTELAIEYYDETIFKGKRFSDIDLAHGPFIEINATDLGAGSRFAFVQAYFDLICSDLMDLKVARAVTASSAVPIMFPTVVLENHAGECDASKSSFVEHLMAKNADDPRVADLQNRAKRYLDRNNHPYIHLIDGGISDNLGMRALVERIETYGAGLDHLFKVNPPKQILVISVDAEVLPPRTVDQSPDKPSIAETIGAFSDVQLRLYNNETRILMTQKLDQIEKDLAKAGTPVKIYWATVSFSAVAGKSLRDHLNSLPTSLELSTSDIEVLDRVAGELLREDRSYRAFLKEVNGRRRSLAP